MCCAVLFANFSPELSLYVFLNEQCLALPTPSSLTCEQHTTGHEFDTNPSLSDNVTISQAEHEYLVCPSCLSHHVLCGYRPIMKPYSTCSLLTFAYSFKQCASIVRSPTQLPHLED